MLYKLYHDRDPSGLVARKLRKNMYIVKLLSRVRLFATLWTIALQAPLPMRFSRQEHWSGWPQPPQRIFLTQGANPYLLHFLLLAGRLITTCAIWEAPIKE